MTEEQKKWFEKLSKDRTESADVHDKPSERGYWKSVVDKYSDTAHFIYELLQNADDCKAEKVEFKLQKDGLFFIHNGKDLFTLTDVDTEREDGRNNKLGHINSICSVGNSTKTTQSIGKFGLGFKSVFQFTRTAYIHDPLFQFSIKRFIVPELLDEFELNIFNIFENKQEKTIFWFPFNHMKVENIDTVIDLNDRDYYETWNNRQRIASEAYDDISRKLNELIYPTLFLNNLKEVVWTTENSSGEYSKTITQKNNYNEIEILQKLDSTVSSEKLILFSKDIEDSPHKYSIGFFYDEDNKLIAKELPAFCFFPIIKEATNLNFIINAPFLLIDSRSEIDWKQGNFEYNKTLTDELANLAAESLITLRDNEFITDDIIQIIPYKKPKENDLFSPFYYRFKEKLQTEDLLPAKDGGYVKKENAYWFQDKPIIELFSNEQLQLLINNPNAKWVFSDLARNQTTGESEGSYPKTYPKQQYIDSCVKEYFEMEKLFQKITADFIKKQKKEWLHKLYEYLSKTLKTYESVVKNKAIFIDSNDNAVPAFDSNKQPILFLPTSTENTSFKTIHPDLMDNENSIEFFTVFGIKEPSLKDEIYNHILPLYNTKEGINTLPHFKVFFKYWKEEGRPEDFINLIKDKPFILLKTNNNDTRFRGKASEIYYPTPDLVKYFETKPDTKFVDLDDNYSFITEEKEQQILKDFLLKLGVRVLPIIYKKEIKDYVERNRFNLSHYTGRSELFDKYIDGSKELIKDINKERSKLLWGFLLKYKNLNDVFIATHNYFYRTNKVENFHSSEFIRLTISKWLLSSNGNFVAPNEITINELADGYERNAELERLLRFKPTVILTETERIAQKFESEEEAELAKKLLDEYKTRQNATTANNGNNRNSNKTGTDFDYENPEQPKTSKIEKTIKDLDDLQNEFTPKQKDDNNESQSNVTKSEINFDEDEEFAKGIEDLKKQLEIKKSRVDLAENISNSEKYSYDWFKAYLQLLTTYGEKQDTQRQKSISFQQIKPYKSDNKYFLLCGASSYISPEIENADDFKVSLVFGNGNRENITVEGVSKKGQDLLIYCREPLSGNTLSRFSNIFKVEINFTPVIDLLDRLYTAFTNDNNIDEWENIKEAMPSLNFIYGPPGTGKTTTLCNNINDILAENPNAKFLVLTPTNKAADVVCKKLQDINPTIYAVRLSRPTDPELEESGIYVDTLDNKSLHNINVVTSTIHRFPYFEINGEKDGENFEYKLFKHRNFDYVIFDEASMTGLHYITFAIMALFKTNQNINFIVAGDPKQIPPVIEIDEKELENFDFQDENIYKMMKLENFNPEEQTIREIDTITNLITQYRSIPQIGQLFSELSYSSLLIHDRATNRKESKQLPEEFKNLISSNVTFVDIPLNQNNSIYRVNNLFYSSYHTYCAILVSEIVRYFDKINKNEQWTIGLIAPYKAQAILLNKLITSYGISEKVKVFSDTVHGFQGDECDIVFFVCNPNNYKYTGDKNALLSKEYIYNVAISRAKDYLIILHPYSAIQNNNFINKIGHSYRINFGNTTILNAKNIEKILFKDENYIENNSYVSGHDSVNVFGLSEMKYFIKANDTAIDIQLRDLQN